VPKIVINNAINYSLTAIGNLVISNHNSFRVVFEKKLLPCILFENIFFYFSIRNGQPGETSTVPIVSALLDAADDGQPVPESVLDRFIRFCRTHYGVQRTDRHAYHGTSMTIPCRVM